MQFTEQNFALSLSVIVSLCSDRIDQESKFTSRWVDGTLISLLELILHQIEEQAFELICECLVASFCFSPLILLVEISGAQAIMRTLTRMISFA
jgi:hypothetical protein